jgi:preprotein translocase subunit SecE
MKVKRIIAYTLSVLVLLFSAVAILGIWDLIDIEYLISRMFKSLMVILAAAAVIVLIFSILDRPEREEHRPERGEHRPPEQT